MEGALVTGSDIHEVEEQTSATKRMVVRGAAASLLAPHQAHPSILGPPTPSTPLLPIPTETKRLTHLPRQRRQQANHHAPNAHRSQRGHIQREVEDEPRPLILPPQQPEGGEGEGGGESKGFEHPAEHGDGGRKKG